MKPQTQQAASKAAVAEFAEQLRASMEIDGGEFVDPRISEWKKHFIASFDEIT